MELPIPEPEGRGRHELIAIGGGCVLARIRSSHGSRRRTPCRCSTAGGSTISCLALLTWKRSSVAEPTRLPQGCTYGTVTDFGVMRVLTFTDPDSRTVEPAHWVGGARPNGSRHVQGHRRRADRQRAASPPTR
jgi:hypothetical protein